MISAAGIWSQLHRSQIVRFGVVGVGATAIYWLVSTLLPMLTHLAISPTVAALIASLVSVLASYLGHHRFTFSKVGQHTFYLPRFLLISAVLSGAATLATFVFTTRLHADYRLVSLGVTLAYPPSSFILNRLWTFR